MNFDGLLYIMCVPLIIISALLVIVNVILYLLEKMTLKLMLLNILKYLGLAYVLLALSAVLIVLMDKRSLKKMAKGILTYPIFMLSWSLINLAALFKKDVKWSKIEHVKNVDIKEIN